MAQEARSDVFLHFWSYGTCWAITSPLGLFGRGVALLRGREPPNNRPDRTQMCPSRVVASRRLQRAQPPCRRRPPSPAPPSQPSQPGGAPFARDLQAATAAQQRHPARPGGCSARQQGPVELGCGILVYATNAGGLDGFDNYAYRKHTVIIRYQHESWRHPHLWGVHGRLPPYMVI